MSLKCSMHYDWIVTILNGIEKCVYLNRKVIAGVALCINSESGIEVREQNPLAEFFFALQHLPVSDHEIHIQISDSRMPILENFKPLFSANNEWSIYKDEQFYRIVLNPPAFNNPLWIAQFNHEFSQGIVHCGDRLKDSQNGKVVLFNPVSYPLDQILLMHFLAQNRGMVIHATGWLYHDSGWIFAGKSGAGKSTLSNLIVKATGSRFLSDDRIIIRKVGHEFLMYGTPWPGEAGYAMNQSVPLKGIFFLKKGGKNNTRELKPSDAFAGLMPVVSIPWYDREKVELMMDFCSDLVGALPMYELTFVPDKAIASYLETFIGDLTSVF